METTPKGGIQMHPTTRIEVPARLTVLVTLAQLLERLERSRTPVDPEQYRSVVHGLTREFASVDQDEKFRQLMTYLPAASELYENLNYEHAGLCRSPLDSALEAEIAARSVLARMVRRPSV